MFKDEDLNKYNQLSKVISQGNFDLKGDAVIHAASLLLWFNQLGPRLQLAIKQEKDKNKPPTDPVEKLDKED